jgi:leucyl/phenylalanyl-tRNA--protein transferase
LIPWIGPQDPFPDVRTALSQPNGLLAAGANLEVPRLLEAYRRGIFPWFSDDDPILWWSPDPRMVLLTSEFHPSRSLRRTLRKGIFEIQVDSAFDRVVEACSAPRDAQSGTWITPQMKQAYGELYRQGHAHSIEAWQGGRLVGGLYGVAIGRMFFGESMFTRETDASKAAFSTLVRQLNAWEFPLVDCQMETAHLASLGARPITRDEYVRRVAELVHYPPVALPWKFDVET